MEIHTFRNGYSWGDSYFVISVKIVYHNPKMCISFCSIRVYTGSRLEKQNFITKGGVLCINYTSVIQIILLRRSRWHGARTTAKNSGRRNVHTFFGLQKMPKIIHFYLI